MDIRRRHFGRIALTEDGNTVSGVDLSELLTRLLLFENVVIDTAKLHELTYLVELCGPENARSLLQADGVGIHLEMAAVVQMERPEIRTRGSKLMGAGPFDYGILRMAQRDRYLDAGIDRIKADHSLHAEQTRKIDSAVRSRLIPPNPTVRDAALSQTASDIGAGSPVVRKAILASLNRHAGLSISDETPFRLDFKQLGSHSFDVETDLPSAARVADRVVLAAIESGLLAVAAVNAGLEDMKTHSALIGFDERDRPIVETKLGFLRTQVDPDEHRDRLSRVLELTDLPRLDDATQLGRADVERLLEVRQSAECSAFRDWLWNADEATDKEIRDRFRSVRARLGTFAREGTGKTVRWLASTGLGLVPGAGPALGAGAGLIDSFVVEKLLPNRGALTFLGKQYQSIFK